VATDPLTIEFALGQWIEALPACAEVGLRVYPWARAPQRTAARPFCLYHRVGSGRLRSLSGPSGVSHPTVQLDFVGRDYLQVRRVAAAVRLALEGLAFGAELAAGRTVQVAIVDREDDAGDADAAPAFGDEAAEHRVSMDVRIWFPEE
jgi:hypothetical protein